MGSSIQDKYPPRVGYGMKSVCIAIGLDRERPSTSHIIAIVFESTDEFTEKIADGINCLNATSVGRPTAAARGVL